LKPSTERGEGITFCVEASEEFFDEDSLDEEFFVVEDFFGEEFVVAPAV
jgi:hypothetical protein